MHCLWNPQPLYSKKKIYIKIGSYGTIYTFKNYFVTVFSVFSFNNNKFNLNGLLVYEVPTKQPSFEPFATVTLANSQSL